MTTENTNNRLSAGEIGALTVWLTTNKDRLFGKGYSATAKIADGELPFTVTEPNVRNLCTAVELPGLVAIHPKAQEEQILARLARMESRIGDAPVLPAELTPQMERMVERIQKFEAYVADINSMQGAQSDTLAKLGQVAAAIAPRIDSLEQSQQGIASGLQCLKELIHVLDRDLDPKSWAARWRDSATEPSEDLALDGGVCGND